MRLLRSVLLFCSVLFISTQSANAQLTIQINQGLDKATPIAIVPFGFDGPLQNYTDPTEIISNDLKMSGFFQPMPQANMLSFPTPGKPIFFRDWRLPGMEYVLTGSIKPNAGGYEVTFELHDVIQEKMILSAPVQGGINDMRDIAHYISDQVYKKITGIDGIFSTKILYVTDLRRLGKQSYRLMQSDQDGAREFVILESAQPLMSPTWSPDRSQVAYVSFETGRPAIFRQVIATGVREQLTNFTGINGAPSWSPDGQKLAMTLSKDGNPEIYVLDLQTRQFTRITNHFAIDTEPNWLPDSRSLAFTSDRGGRPQIYKVDTVSKSVERITFEGDYNARPRLSPDGRFLVMVHQKNSVFHIAVQDLQTDRLQIVTQTQLDESPTIAPNGAMIMYATKWGEQSILAAVSLDAGVKYRLPEQTTDVREPAWSPF